MVVLWILGGLAALYLIFILGPAVVSYRIVFSRRAGTSLEAATAPGGDFAPWAELLRGSRDALLRRGLREVSIRSGDGLRLAADYLDAGAERTAVLLHGYHSDPMLNLAVQAEAFAARGWNLLIPDQRGHGRSEGAHLGLGLLEQEDLLGWTDWVRSETGVRRIVVGGVSMGAATAAYAADRLDPETVEALVLDCGFSSPDAQISGDCRKRHLPTALLMPVIRLLAKRRLGLDLRRSVRDSLARTGIPAFFLHGTEDRTVPWAEGRANCEACASRKQFYSVTGAGHAAAFITDREGAEQALFAFLEEVAPAAERPDPHDTANS